MAHRTFQRTTREEEQERQHPNQQYLKRITYFAQNASLTYGPESTKQQQKVYTDLSHEQHICIENTVAKVSIHRPYYGRVPLPCLCEKGRLLQLGQAQDQHSSDYHTSSENKNRLYTCEQVALIIMFGAFHFQALNYGVG